MIVVQRRPIDSLKPHPDNPRLGDVDAIKESIRINGWHGVVVIQEGSHHILVGNHRTAAARELQRGDFNPWPDQSNADYENERARWKAELANLPVHVLACDDDTARRVLLADNRTADRATYDDNKLLRLHAQIVDPEAAVEVLADPAASPDDVAEALRVIAQKQARTPRLRGTGYSSNDVEQLALSLEGGAAREWGSEGTADDARERYDTGGLRQIVIIMTVEEYEQAIPKLNALGDKYGLETNTDVFFWMLERLTGKEEADEPAAE